MTPPDSSSAGPHQELHGKRNGHPVHLFTLKNAKGMTATISELGAQLISLTMPDQKGQHLELTLGHDDFEAWCHNNAYLGATCGRFGNRIAHGEFTLEGKLYTLATNNEPAGIPCHLHGGTEGFNQKIWQATPLVDVDRQGVAFSLTSPDGEEGYPGNLEVTVTYWLNNLNELTWEVTATTDKATPVNIINHTYWNLSGNVTSTITDHVVQLYADHFLPTNAGMIPTGEIRHVSGTPMDFTQPKLVEEGIGSDYEPIQTGAGYDHCWVINGYDGTLRPAASVYHPGSGIRMKVFTDQPGVQFYTGNFLEGNHPPRSGLCLETEGFPDAPNHPNFPSSILQPGDTYQHRLVIIFE